VTAHTPELLLNNFETRLGHTVGRMFAALFPQVPQFQGRQAVTFHNQRDFIFFRRHRYIFKDGKRCDLQELGPRFTLKLRSLQKGTFDTKHGEFEWVFRVSFRCI
jgi:ribosome production factor 1